MLEYFIALLASRYPVIRLSLVCVLRYLASQTHSINFRHLNRQAAHRLLSVILLPDELSSLAFASSFLLAPSAHFLNTNPD